MKKEWKFIQTETPYKDNVLSIDRKTYLFNKINRSMPFTVINTKDWVIIIPEINDKFVMVKQFRVAANITTLEFPGGAINKDEDKLKGALRELREETGLEPGKMFFLGTIRPNPAILSNCCHVFYAKNCKYEHETNFDDFEDIEISEVSVKEFENSVKNGEITHSLVLAAYSLYILNQKDI